MIKALVNHSSDEWTWVNRAEPENGKVAFCVENVLRSRASDGNKITRRLGVRKVGYIAWCVCGLVPRF